MAPFHEPGVFQVENLAGGLDLPQQPSAYQHGSWLKGRGEIWQGGDQVSE